MALFLIPFTYSIVCGVGFSYFFYIAIGLFTGDLAKSLRELLIHVRFGSESASIWRDNAPNYKAAASDELELGPEAAGVPPSRRRASSVIDKLFPNDLSEQQSDNAFSYLAT